tara:strand:- start:243 stop:431 length:189 start_codon:yes stop_codon:yes gene_type:complete
MEQRQEWSDMGVDKRRWRARFAIAKAAATRPEEPSATQTQPLHSTQHVRMLALQHQAIMSMA